MNSIKSSRSFEYGTPSRNVEVHQDINSQISDEERSTYVEGVVEDSASSVEGNGDFNLSFNTEVNHMDSAHSFNNGVCDQMSSLNQERSLRDHSATHIRTLFPVLQRNRSAFILGISSARSNNYVVSPQMSIPLLFPIPEEHIMFAFVPQKNKNIEKLRKIQKVNMTMAPQTNCSESNPSNIFLIVRCVRVEII